ncbi:MAG: hypothetical protein F6K50_17540 [Moorea sp. SIO3I7]|nr:MULTISPECIES: hypothetical protein [unclassified Moorena]NEN97263.1 hypothetical protein [Moorena sp. SIO3I7]NEO06245.1 hypothetical protein [Moorena sp. SIO3I8]NEO19089.1 hypothetical protein [Moorena sp. SIO4A5]NEQ56705.1 hypothetical protein [Moorena sp. SIO4A1]
MKRIMQAMLAIVFALVAVLSLQVGHAYAQDVSPQEVEVVYEYGWFTVKAEDSKEINVIQDRPLDFDLVDKGDEGSTVFVFHGCGAYKLEPRDYIYPTCEHPSSKVIFANGGPDDVDIKIFPQ